MNIRKIATITLLVLSSFAANNVAPSNAELEAMYDRAFKAFNSNNYPQALKELDGIDARQPDLAQSQNLRGVIYMREQKYDEAEKALQKALASDPKFWNARFNLAEIPFLQKNWAEARNRFQGLLFGNDLQLQGEALQLIQYKILLTYLLEGKENMVDSIMAKLELAPDTPAMHYANAAIAFQRKNEAEAKDWLAKAEKNFSPQLNKLFAESIYEIGWMQKPAGETRAAVELTSAADRAAKAKAFARSKFEEAEQAFQQRDFTAARKAIDEAEAADPNQPPYINLRGEILMAQKDFDGAEAAFRQAEKIDPKYREAQYNLAQIPFKKRDYAKARERFEALFGATPAPNAKDQTAQLIKFNVYLTLLLDGKDSRAQKMMEQFQFTGDTPALYYAQAAWEFKHNNAAKANDWVTSARKIYSPAMNRVFADAFYDLGWLQNAPAAPAQSSAEVAKIDSTPTVEPTAIPGAALASNTSKQPAQKTASAEQGVPGMEATTERSPAAIAQTDTNKVAPTPGASLSPSVETPVAANASPAESQPAIARESAAPVASQAPAVATAEQNSPETAVATPAATASETTAAASSPAAVDASATPATVLAPAKVREWSQPTFGERLQRYVDLNALIVGGLVLAAIVILAVVAVPSMRRRGTRTSIFQVPAPATAPKFATTRLSADERVASRPTIVAGPPQVSLQLKASEPSVRRAAVPFTKPNRSFGNGAGFSSAGVGAPAEQPAPVASAVEPIAPPQALRERTEQQITDEPAIATVPELEEISAPSADNGAIAADAALPTVDEQSTESMPVAAETSIAEAQPTAEPTGFAPAPEIPAVEDATVEQAAEITAPQPSEDVASAEPPTDFVSEPAAEAPAAEIETTPDIEAPAAPAAPAEPEAESLEPIGQGQPVPHLIPATAADEQPRDGASSEPEPAQPQQSRFAKILAAGAALAGVGALRRPSQPEAPSEPETAPEPAALAPEPVSNEPTDSQPSTQQTTPIEIMPPPTQPTPAPALRTTPQNPMTGAAPQAQPQSHATGGMQTAVQLTFSFEIAALQLTPTFKMGALQLRPTSRIVSMRLAPSQQPQPAMNLQVSFEIANVQLTGNAIGTLRLTPSQQQRPNLTGSSAFSIAGLQLLPGAENAALQLTPAGHQAAVQVTGRYQIATVEFSPSFEIAALVLNSTSRQVSVQLPGSTQTPVEGAPVFDISNVQLGGGGEITVMQLTAPGAGAAAPRPA